MEIENINQFLDGKTFLVTGATGLIAKILIEKLLRVQPNLKKLYILVREKNGLSARERLKREVCIDGFEIDRSSQMLGRCMCEQWPVNMWP
ncbi:putative fatty acyl-CoA reductase 5, partial [Drosera capensis]